MTKTTGNHCECEFCREFENPPNTPNRILWEDSSFVLLPTIGSFTPGYLLLMPRRHVVSFASLPKSDIAGAWRVAEKVRTCVETDYGPSIIAEHGMGLEGTPSSACCDHAHLHIIPCDPHKVSAEYEAAGGSPRVLSGIDDLRNWTDTSYMFLSPLKNVLWAWPHSSSFLPQFVRQVCAKILGREEFYDWAVFPYRENMLQTRSSVAVSFASALTRKLNPGVRNEPHADSKSAI